MTIKINSITRTKSLNGIKDVCISVHYTYSVAKTTGKYDDLKNYTSQINHTLGLGKPDDSFIEYEKLTEENVKKWIEDSLGQDELDKMKHQLETMIEYQIDPPTASGLPW